MTNLALFDLDHTLIPIDSDHEWGRFMMKLGIVDSESFTRENNLFFNAYKAGKLDIRAYLASMLSPLAKYSRAQLSEWHAQYMQEIIQPEIMPVALNLVRSHINNGDLCCVVTATNEFITRPIALAFGISALIACEVETVDGHPDSLLTGRSIGVPSYREGKVKRTEAWLSTLGKRFDDFKHSYFYSDSHNDIPLLERVTDPVVTNSDDVLRAYAQKRGWKILDLFKT
ncbi:MAG: HAD family hydrolase [Burkholderia sp.]|nr:HAD family hydrolase [Burkholderia sp.]